MNLGVIFDLATITTTIYSVILRFIDDINDMTICLLFTIIGRISWDFESPLKFVIDLDEIIEIDI